MSDLEVPSKLDGGVDERGESGGDRDRPASDETSAGVAAIVEERIGAGINEHAA